jgi:hypothetical protein
MKFSDPELINPVVHCFARCYMCKKLVAIPPGDNDPDLSGRDCPHCGVHLTQQRIINTLVENILNTQAVTSAHKLASFDPAAIIVLVINVVVASMGLFPVWFRAINVVLYVMPVVAILRWFRKFWWTFRFTDEEYLEALRHMKLSLLLWTFTELLSAALLLIP